MRELTESEVSLVSGGWDFDAAQFGIGIAIVAGAVGVVAAAGTIGTVGIGVAGAYLAGEMVTAGFGLSASLIGGIVAGDAISS